MSPRSFIRSRIAKLRRRRMVTRASQTKSILTRSHSLTETQRTFNVSWGVLSKDSPVRALDNGKLGEEFHWIWDISVAPSACSSGDSSGFSPSRLSIGCEDSDSEPASFDSSSSSDYNFPGTPDYSAEGGAEVVKSSKKRRTVSTWTSHVPSVKSELPRLRRADWHRSAMQFSRNLQVTPPALKMKSAQHTKAETNVVSPVKKSADMSCQTEEILQEDSVGESSTPMSIKESANLSMSYRGSRPVNGCKPVFPRGSHALGFSKLRRLNLRPSSFQNIFKRRSSAFKKFSQKRKDTNLVNIK